MSACRTSCSLSLTGRWAFPRCSAGIPGCGRSAGLPRVDRGPVGGFGDECCWCEAGRRTITLDRVEPDFTRAFVDQRDNATAEARASEAGAERAGVEQRA